MSARHSSFDTDGIPPRVIQSLRAVCGEYCTLMMDVENLYEDAAGRIWDYSGNTRTRSVVPHRERLDRFRFLHQRNRMFDGTNVQIDESFLERTERPFWGPEQTAGVVRQNTETFYLGLNASESVPLTTASSSDVYIQNDSPLLNLGDHVVELIEQIAQLDYLVAEMSNRLDTTYNLMEVIEELVPDSPDYISLEFPIDNLDYDWPTAEADPSDIAALPRLPVDALMMGDKGDAECTICKVNVQLNDEVIVLPCNHWFHSGCIGTWLGISNTCPCCRRPASS